MSPGLTATQLRLLQRARRADDQIGAAKTARTRAVRACRDAGIEWVPIADVLGLTVLGASKILTREAARGGV